MPPARADQALHRGALRAAKGTGDWILRCIGPDQFVKDVFMDSDTDLMVLSFVPSTREGEPLTIEEAAATARIVEQLNGTHRLLLHGRVNPNQRGDLEGMDELAARYKISAWKTYTQWGPDGAGGFFMDDEPGIRLIEKARKLGIRNHRDPQRPTPSARSQYEPLDVPSLSRRVREALSRRELLIYHSGFVADSLKARTTRSAPKVSMRW